jgi:hypothetical protein
MATIFVVLGACAPPTAALPYPAQAAAEGEPVAAESAAPTDVVRYFEREVALEPLVWNYWSYGNNNFWIKVLLMWSSSAIPVRSEMRSIVL